jgi:CHAD domain-containing protein
MPYRLERDEQIEAGLRRCAREQLDAAIEELTAGVEIDPVSAVHDAREALKKQRSLLRLGRGAIDPAERRRENASLRGAARRLGGARDADVMIAALDDLAQRYAGQTPTAAFAPIRQQLRERQEEMRRGLLESGSPRTVAADLGSARARIDDWQLAGDGHGWSAISAGLGLSYRRGRRALCRARMQPTPENMHEWRKRCKDLWYHLRLLRPISPDTMRGHAQDAHRLSDLLGDLHDLSVLRDSLVATAGEVPADTDAVLGLTEHRSEQLHAEALLLGDRIYAERPKAFVHRMSRYWNAWREEAEVAGARDPVALAEATRPAAAA